MFFLKKCLFENTFIPQGMGNLLLVSVTLLRPIFHIWKSLRLSFLLLCLFLCGSQQHLEAMGNEHGEKSPFPSCLQFTERKSNHVPQAALGTPPCWAPQRSSLLPIPSPCLERIWSKVENPILLIHQKLKGTIYALIFSYICLYHCFKLMTIWVSCVLPCLDRYGCMNKLLVADPGGGHRVPWGLCSHPSHTSPHFV